MANRIGDINCWVRIFEVSEPTKHRKGFTVYKVTSTVFPRAFPESATKIVVWKRYSDFQKLHKELEQVFQQLYLRGDFPGFPKAKMFGRFEEEVIEHRRVAALTLLEFAANYMQLFTNKAFIQFFENGYNTQDFLGKILFSNGEDVKNEDPPTVVHHEISEINIPCLKPEKVWNTAEKSKNDDSMSISSSSVSPNLSPDKTVQSIVDACSIPNSSTSTAAGLDNEVDVNERSEKIETVSADSTVLTSSAETSSEINKTSSDTPSNTHISSGSLVEEQSSQDKHNETASSSSNTKSRSTGIVRSATVTDDLNAYFDEEFEDAAFLFPMGSCSSLDALPGYTSSAESIEPENSQTQSLAHSSRSQGLFSLPRRKPSGFGLFDFLPLFQKKIKKKENKDDKGKQPKVESDKANTLTVGYICEAAGHFAVAQFHESNADYADAFTAYKEGIRVLLTGAQDDNDRDRKCLAKNKLEKYLTRAESIKESFLTPDQVNSRMGEISPVFSSPNKKEKCLSALQQKRLAVHDGNGSVPSSLEDLKLYKVVGLGSHRSKIILVMSRSEASTRCYAVKVLWKASLFTHPDKPTIIPGRVPFMVKLEKWFDTPDKIILLLQNAGGGRLVDFVTNYQFKRTCSDSPTELDTPSDDNQSSNKEVGDVIPSDKSEKTKSANKRTEKYDNGTLDHAVLQLERTHSGLVDRRPEETSVNVAGLAQDGTPFLTPPDEELQPSNSKKLAPEMEVSKLLENSKALLQNVAKMLEESRNSKGNISESSAQECESLSREFQIGEETTNNGNDSYDETQNLSKRKDVTPLDNEDISDLSETPKRMIPEGCIKVWAAELIMALEALHDAGITYGNLDVNDILLGENGHVLLKYKSLYKEIDDPIRCNSYMAPEVRDSIGVPLWKIHPSADWWSVGAILFLLISGQAFDTIHPEGVFPDMVVKIPECSVAEHLISKSAQTLLLELLQHSPELRLGYYGAAEIKSHPFFDGFDWNRAAEEWSVED